MTFLRLMPLTLLLATALQGERVQYCILFGVGDEEPTRWDGSLEASGARILDLSGWRLGREDSVSGSSWRLATRRIDLTRSITNLAVYPALETGVYALAETIGADPVFRIRTSQGSATFHASEVGFGSPLRLLDGRVSVEQIPVTTVLTDSIEEQDLPAIARFGDTVYMAYVEFTHGAREMRWRRQLRAEPDSFDPLSRPAGGDRLWLREYSVPSGQWGEALAVGAGGQDIYSAALAVDGQGRVWVIVDFRFILTAASRIIPAAGSPGFSH